MTSERNSEKFYNTSSVFIKFSSRLPPSLPPPTVDPQKENPGYGLDTQYTASSQYLPELQQASRPPPPRRFIVKDKYIQVPRRIIRYESHTKQ